MADSHNILVFKMKLSILSTINKYYSHNISDIVIYIAHYSYLQTTEIAEDRKEPREP